MSAQLNLMRSANQAQLLGNTNPPNLSGISDGVLQAASPSGFSLLNATKTNKDSSDKAAAACREYKDIEGLRRLQKDQANKTFYDAGCGWRYRPSNGIVPEINQGALGTASGPTLAHSGSPDEVVGGTRWYSNLNTAEREITAKICGNASKCSQLKLLGKYSEICGYCKTSGAVIPIMNRSARYPKDPSLQCQDADIVTAMKGACPKAEGFLGYRNEGPRGNVRRTEGFTGLTLDDLDQCSDSPLSRDCVVLAARMSGCSDNGTLIKSLNAAPESGDYDTVLQKNPVFNAYKSVASPGITKAMLQDGSVSLDTALDDFATLGKNAGAGNTKLGYSARDLCYRGGEFEQYDFCAEITGPTIISSANIGCIQQRWKNAGGSAEGTGYPTLATWTGKTFDQFMEYMKSIQMTVQSADRIPNAGALKQLTGMDTSYKQVVTAKATLPMSDNTRGAETVWIDLTNSIDANAIPVILRCDLRLRKEKQEVVPFFSSPDEMKSKYGFASHEHKAYMSAFEFRVPAASSAVFYTKTDDGFMMSKNQNPFEGTGNAANDWGSWRYQAATGYYSPEYPITAEKDGKTNTFITKYFNGPGGACSQFSYFSGGKKTGGPGKFIRSPPGFIGWNPDGTKDVYGVGSCQTGACSGQNITACGNFKQLTQAEFNTYTHKGGFDCSMMPGTVGGEWKMVCASEDVYLTQEPLAPWLQFEICSRPNNGRGNAVGFFEKRWNGPVGFVLQGTNYSSGPAIPGFDVESAAVTFKTVQVVGGTRQALVSPYTTDPKLREDVPGRKGYMSFTSSSWWLTKSFFHFTAFKTITILVRPMANLADGGNVSIFAHSNLRTIGTGCSLVNNGGKYSVAYQMSTGVNQTCPITPNEWNLIVLQYLGDKNGLRSINCNVESLETLKKDDGRKKFLAKLQSQQSLSGKIILGQPNQPYLDAAGWLILGGAGAAVLRDKGVWRWGQQGFTGDIGWIHGFRDFIDTDDVLKNEVKQTWMSRWPRGNLDSDDGVKTKCTFDAMEYNDMYPDLQNAFHGNVSQLENHYKGWGINEERSPCGMIDPDCRFNDNTYYALNPDVKAAKVDAKVHFKTWGMNEKRNVCAPK